MLKHKTPALVVALLIGGGIAAVATHHDTPELTGTDAGLVTTPASLEEDEAGWNCLTMGNRVCGGTDAAGQHYAVTVAEDGTLTINTWDDGEIVHGIALAPEGQAATF